VELYETHDKYTFVGHLVDDPVNDILEQVEDMDNNVEIMEGDEIESDERHNEANQAESLSEEAVEGWECEPVEIIVLFNGASPYLYIPRYNGVVNHR